MPTVRGLATPDVLALSGVPASTLNYWTTRDLVDASVIGSDGQRFMRYWSIEDAVMVRTIKALRDAGCPLADLAQARTVVDHLARQ